MTLRSWPQLKSRARGLPNWTNQVPQNFRVLRHLKVMECNHMSYPWLSGSTSEGSSILCSGFSWGQILSVLCIPLLTYLLCAYNVSAAVPQARWLQERLLWVEKIGKMKMRNKRSLNKERWFWMLRVKTNHYASNKTQQAFYLAIPSSFPTPIIVTAVIAHLHNWSYASIYILKNISPLK